MPDGQTSPWNNWTPSPKWGLPRCPALVDARLSMLSMMKAYMVPRAYLLPIFDELFGRDEKTTMQFLLDCSVLPPIIRLSQQSENPVLHDIFYLTRTYVFKMFVTRRRRLLGLTTRWSWLYENCATLHRGQNFAKAPPNIKHYTL